MIKNSFIYLIFLFLLSTLIPQQSIAGIAPKHAPLAPVTLSLSQPTGETFQAVAKGNIHFQWYETTDGHPIGKNRDNTWYYLTINNQQPSLSKVKVTKQKTANSLTHKIPFASSEQLNAIATKVTNKALQLQSKAIENQRKEYRNKITAFKNQSKATPAKIEPSNTDKLSTADQPVLVIGVEFRDRKLQHTADELHQLLFGENTNSVKNYFKNISGNNVRLTPGKEYYGVENDGVIITQIEESHPNADNNKIFLNRVMEAIEEDFPISSYEQNDIWGINPDELLILFVVAGFDSAYGGSAISPSIWASTFSYHFEYGWGVPAVNRVSVIGELHGTHEQNHLATIGIIAQQLTQQRYRLPSMTPAIDEDSNDKGVANWGLMGTGLWQANEGEHLGTNPTDLSAYIKELSRLSTPEVITQGSNIQIAPSTNVSSYKKIWIDKYQHQEYFLLSNRQQSADIGAPGKGLLITHVDEKYGYLEGFQPKLAKIEPADGTFTQGDSTDTYGDSSNAKEFTATTTPNTHDNNGNATNIAISGITTNGDTINIGQINANPVGDSISYYLRNSWGSKEGSYSPPSNTYFIGIEVSNDTQMNTIAGVDVYITAPGTANFYLYDGHEEYYLLNQLHSETGFTIEQGWNRILLNQKQPFEKNQTRILMVEVNTPTTTRPAWLVHNSISNSLKTYGTKSLDSRLGKSGSGDFAIAALIEYSDTIDSDGDSIYDALDNCPNTVNPKQTNSDNAADGGDACDNDDDNDGVQDAQDKFPTDPSEHADADQDGIGNNTDNDDDNDGILDSWEALNGLNPLNGDDASIDSDNDGFSNLQEFLARSDPNNAASTPQSNGLTAGSIQWTYQSPSTIHNRPAIGDNGIIYLASNDKLIALNSSGEQQWFINTDNNEPITGAPSISTNSHVYFVHNNTLNAISKTGERLWQYTTESGLDFIGPPSINQQGTLFIATRTKLAAITPRGQKLWSYDLSATTIKQPLVAPDGNIVVAYDNKIAVFDDQGELKWQNAYQHNIDINLSIDQTGSIYLVQGNTIQTISTNSVPRKTYWFDNAIISPPSIADNGNIYVMDSTNTLLNINKAGTLLWRYTNSSQSSNQNQYHQIAIAANGNTYLVSNSNQQNIQQNSADLKAFDNSGQLLWQQSIATAITTAPILDANGDIYVAANNSALYKFYDSNRGPAKNNWPMAGQNARNSKTLGDGSASPTRSPQIIDFKTGEFNQGHFYFSGDKNWTITNNPSVRDSINYAMGTADDGGEDQLSSVTLKVTTDSGLLSFNSEVRGSNANILSFYLDGELKSQRNSMSGWRKSHYYLDAGEHVLTWVYEKTDNDPRVTAQLARIDNIVLPNPVFSDQDDDGIDDSRDNCPSVANADQLNTDGANDGGDACDDDDDNDGYLDNNDDLPKDNSEWLDSDQDGIGNNKDFDNDNDQMADEWEIANGFDPSNNIDATADADGDGFTNLEEYLAGTNPHDASSIPNTNQPEVIYDHNGNFITSLTLGHNNHFHFIDDNNYVTALNEQNELKWQYQLPTHTTKAATIGPDGTVYAVTANYTLIALTDQGEFKWSLKFKGLISEITIGALGNVIINVKDKGMYSIKHDGTINWHYENRNLVYNPVVDSNGNIYTASGGNFLISLSNDGQLNWQTKIDNNDYASANISLDNKGFIYVSTLDSKLQKRASTGQLIWETQVSNLFLSFHSAAVDNNGNLYVMDSYNTLYAFNQDGEILWQYTLTNPSRNEYRENVTPAIGADGTIYITSWDGLFYAFNQYGQVKWQFTSNSYFAASPIIAGEKLYIGDVFGDIYSLSLTDTGTPQTHWPMFGANPQHTNSLALGNNSDIDADGIIDSIDNCIYDSNPDQTNTDGADDGGDACDSDDDNDGMSDVWELANGTNPLIDDTLLDADNDGYTNLEEFNAGTDPTSALSNPQGSGKKLWQVQYSEGLSSMVAIGPENNIYVHSMGNTLSKYNSDGVLQSTKNVVDNISSNIVITPSGNIYFGISYFLETLDKLTQEQWIYLTDGVINTPVVDAQNNIYISSADSHLYALNNSGELLWKYQTNSEIDTQPTIDEKGNIHLSEPNGIYHVVNKQGERIGGYTLQNNRINASIAHDGQGNSYLATDNGLTVIKDYQQIHWQFELNQGFSAAPAIGKDGNVYVGGNNGTLYALNSSGQIRWQYDFSGDGITKALNTTPIISNNGNVIISDGKNSLLVFDANGNIQWRAWTESPIKHGLNIDNNGTIYALTEANQLIAFKSNQTLNKGPWPMHGANRSLNSSLEGKYFETPLNSAPSVAPWVNYILQLQFDD